MRNIVQASNLLQTTTKHPFKCAMEYPKTENSKNLRNITNCYSLMMYVFKYYKSVSA